MKVSVIIPAAGLGTRMGRSAPEKTGVSRKQFMLLNNSPILIHTVRKFVSTPAVSEIVVALRQEDMRWAEELFAAQGFTKAVRLVEGGETRQQSVEKALASLSGHDETDLVAVHDAVRPFIEREIIEKVIAEASETGAAIVGIVPVDTVKQVHRNKVRSTLPRERLILTQTPRFSGLVYCGGHSRKPGRICSSARTNLLSWNVWSRWKFRSFWARIGTSRSRNPGIWTLHGSI
jgi:2-C-methyl-D-erythritol 4-phosphate cytidylyltransferase